MPTTDDILEGARAIRSHLDELIATKAVAVEQELANLLREAETGQNVENRILRLLSRHDASREWMAKFLREEGRSETTRLFKPPPGKGEPVQASKFVCPECDYVWFRRTVGQSAPHCPTHNCPLEPISDNS